jgi:hypothetical protein
MSAFKTAGAFLVGVGGVFVCRSFVSEWATWKRFESSLQHGNPFVNTPATTKGIRALLKCTTYSPEDKGWFLASAIKEKLVYGGEKEDTVKIACDLLLEDPQFYAVLPHLLSRSSRCLDYVLNQFDEAPATSGKKITRHMLEAAVDTHDYYVICALMKRKLIWDKQSIRDMVWYVLLHDRSWSQSGCWIVKEVLKDPRVINGLEAVDRKAIESTGGLER